MFRAAFRRAQHLNHYNMRIRQCDRTLSAQFRQCPTHRLVCQAEMVGNVQPAHWYLQMMVVGAARMQAKFEHKACDALDCAHPAKKMQACLGSAELVK
jgi:hypothetical protein